MENNAKTGGDGVTRRVLTVLSVLAIALACPVLPSGNPGRSGANAIVAGHAEAGKLRVRRAYELYENGRIYRRGCSEFVSEVLKIPWRSANSLMGNAPEASASRRTTGWTECRRATCSAGARATRPTAWPMSVFTSAPKTACSWMCETPGPSQEEDERLRQAGTVQVLGLLKTGRSVLQSIDSALPPALFIPPVRRL